MRPALTLADAGVRAAVDGADLVTLDPCTQELIVCRGGRAEAHPRGGAPPALVDAGDGPPPTAAAASPGGRWLALVRGGSVQILDRAAASADGSPTRPTAAVLAPPPRAGALRGFVWTGPETIALIAADGAHLFAVTGAVGGAQAAGRAKADVVWWAAGAGIVLLGAADGWVLPFECSHGAPRRLPAFAPKELAERGARPASAAVVRCGGDVLALIAPPAAGAAGVYALTRPGGAVVRAGSLPRASEDGSGGAAPLLTAVGGLLVRYDPDAPGAAVLAEVGRPAARVAVAGAPRGAALAAAGDAFADALAGRVLTAALDPRSAADALCGPGGGRVGFFARRAGARLAGAAWRSLLRAPPPVGAALADAAAAMADPSCPGRLPVAALTASLGVAGVGPRRAAAAAAALAAALAARGERPRLELAAFVARAWPDAGACLAAGGWE